MILNIAVTLPDDARPEEVVHALRLGAERSVREYVARGWKLRVDDQFRVTDQPGVDAIAFYRSE